MSDERLRACRKIAKGDDVVAIYARMELARLAERGVRLSIDEVELILTGDDAVSQALGARITIELGDEPL